MKQTAVEWLFEQLNKQGFAQVVTDEEIQQAKEMEKEYKQKVNLLLDTLLENNMCSVVGDELIQTFKSE
jgi:hypothetical protein